MTEVLVLILQTMAAVTPILQPLTLLRHLHRRPLVKMVTAPSVSTQVLQMIQIRRFQLFMLTFLTTKVAVAQVTDGSGMRNLIGQHLSRHILVSSPSEIASTAL